MRAVVGIAPSTIFNLTRRSKMLHPNPTVMAAIYFGIGFILGAGLMYWRERRTMQRLQKEHQTEMQAAIEQLKQEHRLQLHLAVSSAKSEGMLSALDSLG